MGSEFTSIPLSPNTATMYHSAMEEGYGAFLLNASEPGIYNMDMGSGGSSTLYIPQAGLYDMTFYYEYCLGPGQYLSKLTTTNSITIE